MVGRWQAPFNTVLGTLACSGLSTACVIKDVPDFSRRNPEDTRESVAEMLTFLKPPWSPLISFQLTQTIFL